MVWHNTRIWYRFAKIVVVHKKQTTDKLIRIRTYFWISPHCSHWSQQTTCQNQQLLSHHHSLCSKPRFHIRWTTHFFWPDLICLQILLLPYSPASLYPSVPRYQNGFHHRHFHCSLQARLLQLSLSQPAQVSDHPASTDPELSHTCCCQSSQIQSHHSHPPVSTLAKDNWAHWIQAPLTYLQSSHNHPTFISA